MSPLPPGGCPVPPTRASPRPSGAPVLGYHLIRPSARIRWRRLPEYRLSSDRLRSAHFICAGGLGSSLKSFQAWSAILLNQSRFLSCPPFSVALHRSQRNLAFADGACGFEPMAKLVRARTRYRRDAPGSLRSFFNVEWRQKPLRDSPAQMRRFGSAGGRVYPLCSAHLRMSSLALTETHS